MKSKETYKNILLKEIKGSLCDMASFAIVGLTKLERGNKADLEYIQLFSGYFNHIVNVKNPTAPDSLLDPREVLLMYDVFKKYKKYFIPTVENMLYETREFVKRLDGLVSNVNGSNDIAKEELSDLKTLCKIIKKEAESRLPAIEPRIGISCGQYR